MSQTKFTAKAGLWQALLETKAHTLSRESGFVQRRSKMTGACFVQTLVLGWLDNPQASLNQLVQVSRELGVTISVPGLQQRFSKQGVVFLQGMVAAALTEFQQSTRLPAAVLRHFRAVNIVDSSLIQLPDELQCYFRGSHHHNRRAALKLQLSFDYLSGQLNAVEIQAGRSPDQNSLLPEIWAHPDSLTVMDLGFFKKTRFDRIARAGAYFLSRLQLQTALYAHPQAVQPLDLYQVLTALPDTLGELTVYMKAEQPVKVRLIYSRLPQTVVTERRRKARANARRRGETCTQRHLELLAWALFISNVPAEWLSSEQVLLVYRVRWQIELVFKIWKSQAHLDYLGAWGLERVLCQFYAHLLGLICFHGWVAPYRILLSEEVSLVKAFALVQRYALRLVDAIAHHWRGVATLLAKLTEDFQRFALKTPRRKSPSTYQLLVLAGA
jgi:hypothetical protein